MSKYRWLTPLSQIFLDKDYLMPGETLDQRVDVIVARAEAILGIPGFGARFKENLQKGWYSLSTPIWTNFGNDRGLPISCFGSYVEDSLDSILETHTEIGVMTKHGGGTSLFIGNLRERGAKIRGNGESSGSVHFLGLYNAEIAIISQGSTRRGNLACYINIDHPDILDFLTIKSETSPLQNMFSGVGISDSWMELMMAGDIDKRTVWARVLESRFNIGLPYIMFTDNANNGAPDVYRDKGMKIVHSNLCTEIMLPNNADESFVCDLSSMNILHFDEWKDTDAVELLTFFLDAVMTEFIEKASKIKHMERAVRFAERHRAIGIGWLGWHSYLQSKLIPFESFEAKLHNSTVAKTIYTQAQTASAKLAEIFGEPEVLLGYGRRNTTVCAIAPTKSSAFIIGQVSEGIEPQLSNFYNKDLAKGKFMIKNPHLEVLLRGIDKDTPEVWDSILRERGSVQHLEFLTQREKDVFKTFREISPREIVDQAASRQRFIDQGQSLNLMIHPDTSIADLNTLYIHAWQMGIKSLYYQKSLNAAQELARDILSCTSCES
jgi:ribonucleoside-diphosphate reductase alpha chain